MDWGPWVLCRIRATCHPLGRGVSANPVSLREKESVSSPRLLLSTWQRPLAFCPPPSQLVRRAGGTPLAHWLAEAIACPPGLGAGGGGGGAGGGRVEGGEEEGMGMGGVREAGSSCTVFQSPSCGQPSSLWHSRAWGLHFPSRGSRLWN